MSKRWSVLIVVLQGVTKLAFGAIFASFFKFLQKKKRMPQNPVGHPLIA